jgi:dipeptidyl aminopeptidase/acylaminoacyl peptidase
MAGTWRISTRTPATIRDIWLLPLTGPAEPRAYVRSRAVEQDARFSPDGRWLAFVSSESGRAEVYVGPVDDPGARRRVSRDGGLAPRWRRDGKELVYVDLSDTFVAVDTTLGDELKAERRACCSRRDGCSGTRELDSVSRTTISCARWAILACEPNRARACGRADHRDSRLAIPACRSSRGHSQRPFCPSATRAARCMFSTE